MTILVLLISSCNNFVAEEKIAGTNWKINYNWIIGGSGSADIYFFKDGSTDWGGTWTQEEEHVQWKYTTTKTVTYTGTISNKQMTGTMINDKGDSGTWTATKYL